MIELRWVQKVYGTTAIPHDRVLQYRYRHGGIGLSPAALAPGAHGAFATGLRMVPDEGWSPWQDVPVVVEQQAAPAQLPAPEAEETEEREDDAY
jgi:hypothetical protein